jgi:two-component system CheB/CheR fusion protein
VIKGQSFEGFVKLARDLTGQKKQQELQLKRLNDTENSSHLKDEFFAVMSHELKHPLNLIQLKTELLRRLPAVKNVPVASEAVGCIRESVISQARIIDDLLDVARVRTGKLKLRRVPVDLGRVLTDIHTVVVDHNPARSVVLALPDVNGELLVDADPTRLEQIVWNLINNAIKFTPEHGVIRITGAKSGSEVVLRVVDSGVGIEPELLGKVFDLFSQAEYQHASHQREGLGIGLSLVRQLVEAHGGTVDVFSEGVGKGCTFTVRLPLISHPHSAPSEPDAESSDGLLSGIKVLLVDDSAEVLATLSMLLEMECADIDAFDSPHRALEAARTGTYDVIISDIGMPGMNGHELMQALRRLPNCAHVPSIALTGYGAGQDVQKTIDSGFTCHLGKPVDMDVLLSTVRDLRQSRS